MLKSKQEMIEIGERLRSARVRADVTQDQAAAEAEVSRATISNWEAGRNLPSVIQFGRLILLYHEAPFRLLFGRPMFAVERDERVQILKAMEPLPPKLQARLELMLSVLDPA